ncbi:uncharacterized protein LOC126817161 [Patella vulgata]|uniref:uncharacterized protein LOC126817161 n=1 Tax=Patella vulgata TaxID=6465 RepID=UPI0024A81A3C|nr:uncharacterized protein LOC126817161 [Patella vulgata]
MNVDIDSAKNWLMKWKSELDNVPATNLNSEDLYVENLYVSEMKRHILETGPSDLTEKTKIERDLESLKKERAKLKKNVCNSVVESDVNFENEPFNRILKSAQKKRRINSLEKLRQYSSERQYLSSLMKEYADGQVLGSCIGRKLTANTAKIKKELTILNNGRFTSRTEFSDVSLPTLPIFDELSECSLNSDQIKAAEAASLKEHAHEEMTVVHCEIAAYHRYLLSAINDIRSETKDLQLSSSTKELRYMCGKIHYLSTHLYRLTRQYIKSKELFECAGIEHNSATDLNDLILCYIQPEKPLSSEELIDIITDIQSCDLEFDESDVDEASSDTEDSDSESDDN